MNIINKILEALNLEKFIPYLENTGYLVIFLIFLTLLVYFLLNFLFKIFFNSKITKIERKKPSLNEIIDSDSIKPNDDNDFIDVLAAIEEEMTAVRELYVGGYISKGVYIAETDRLYEKAKIFGL